MNADFPPPPLADGEPRGDGSDTVEYETRVSRLADGRPAPRRNRGYWITPRDGGTLQGERPLEGRPLAGVANDDGAEGGRGAAGATRAGTSREGASPRRTKRSRKRRLFQLAVLLVVLAGVVTAVSLVLTGRTVVPVLSEKLFPIHYQDEIALVAEKYDLDPYLIAAVVKTESGYDPDAESPAGAVGLMQLMPGTAEWVTGLSMWEGDAHPDLTDPADNLELGACYLAYLGDSLGDGTEMALAAYNAGPGTVGQWIEEAGGPGEFDLTDIKYPETQQYVERVEHYYLLYKRLHPDVFGAGEPS